MNASNLNQTLENIQFPIQKMELAARNIDKFLGNDASAPRLIDFMNINPQTGSTASGLTDHDYPSLSTTPMALNNMAQIKCVNSVPLPTEITDNISHVQCHCMMGLFPEINRAWLTVDSDLYLWTYEENSDLSYFDGINETILCVGLVKPKPGVFHSFIKYLLVLSTAVDIVVLGVTFGEGPNGLLNEIQLIPDPVFTVPTDGSTITIITGTASGRLFLGSKEGNLFEISYQAQCGWFGKRCKKINLSTSALSFLVPSFLNAALTEEDGIVKMSIDNSRHILYTLTEKGSIEVYDLGEKGNSFSRVTKMSQSSLVTQAMNTVKTLDSQNFRPIEGISAVEAQESSNINLVAVSQTGVRFYMSVVSLSNLQPNQRPYTLTLVHVRLPPGYSANVTVRPRAVHTSHYRDRNLIIVSTVKDKDVLWCLSSDLFPFYPNLMEAYTTINLDGPVLAMAEIKGEHYPSEVLQEDPPLLIRQHLEPPKKFVVLTMSGVQILLKLRPVDILRQILIDSHGYDSEMTKSFFAILKEDQACATSLILASLENDENIEVAELATRTFFTFGGEPKLSPINTTNLFSGTSMFSPNIVSTPAPHHYVQNVFPQGQNMTQQSNPPPFDVNSLFVFSSKHNGLYLYLGRILRPIWNRRCIEKVCLDSKTFTNISMISCDDCIWILNNLSALHNFLLKNTQLSCNNATAVTTMHNTSLNVTQNNSIQDAQLEERQALDALKSFIWHCCQVLGLWRILSEHQFHMLIGLLPEHQQQNLQNTTFKDLFLYRQDICLALITTLVNSYLDDNASVDSISAKLRLICPHLYKTEDAALTKANEILKSIRTVKNSDEKEEMLLSALQLCKTVSSNFNLGEICKQFTSLKAYQAVIELCGHCAKKIDPERVAEHYYNSDRDNATDQEGYTYYQKRMEIYNEILIMLNTLHNEQLNPQESILFNRDNLMLSTEIEQSNINTVTQQVINSILDYSDEIMHVALYDWMVTKQMSNDLIKISQPSLETYLKRSSTQSPDNPTVLDLLWKYYESNGKHAAAAKILNCLASKTGNNLSLKERLTYLARAIMCMSSDRVGYAPYLGVFLRDLEDKMEVAKVQELILDAILNLQGQILNATDAITALNSGLYDVSQLYENFAEPFKLLECQLAVIDCAGYSDLNLIRSIWHDILAEELRKSKGSGNDRVVQVLNKVKQLARQYSSSISCFPLEYIVQELEILNAKLKGDKHLIASSLVSVNIPFERLIEVYNGLIAVSSHDQLWQMEDNEFHLSEATACLINIFLEDHNSYNSVEKRKIISICQDCVAALLSNLYSKPDGNDLINQLRSIQARLSRI